MLPPLLPLTSSYDSGDNRLHQNCGFVQITPRSRGSDPFPEPILPLHCTITTLYFPRCHWVGWVSSSYYLLHCSSDPFSAIVSSVNHSRKENLSTCLFLSWIIIFQIFFREHLGTPKSSFTKLLHQLRAGQKNTRNLPTLLPHQFFCHQPSVSLWGLFPHSFLK